MLSKCESDDLKAILEIGKLRGFGNCIELLMNAWIDSLDECGLTEQQLKTERKKNDLPAHQP